MKTLVTVIFVLSLLCAGSCASETEETSAKEEDIVTTAEAGDLVKEKPGLDINYEPKPGEIVAYSNLDREDLREFLKEPSMDVFYKYCDTLVVFSKSSVQ